MRKILRFLIVCILVTTMAGCSGESSSDSHVSSDSTNVEDALTAGMDKENNKETSSEENAENTDDEELDPTPSEDKETTEKNSEGIDVDLTGMSATMVYSEVYNMMYAPDEYIGKTIKMRGLYSCYQDEATGNKYFACIVQDATACCSQGIEFIPTEDYVYPDDYPTDGEEVTVVGVFDTYAEGDKAYCTLRDADITL